MALPENTHNCLQHLYPNANTELWRVTKLPDGKIEISDWNSELGLKPTEDQLNAVSKDAEVTAKFKYIRKKRNRLLAETDWMSGSDVTMSDKWKKYRQDLRDLPASNSDPSKIVFPTKPE